MKIRVGIKRSIQECRECFEMEAAMRATTSCQECEGPAGTWVDTVSVQKDVYAIVCMDNGVVNQVPLSMLRVIKEEGHD